jgi:hypothetical protein
VSDPGPWALYHGDGNRLNAEPTAGGSPEQSFVSSGLRKPQPSRAKTRRDGVTSPPIPILCSAAPRCNWEGSAPHLLRPLLLSGGRRLRTSILRCSAYLRPPGSSFCRRLRSVFCSWRIDLVGLHDSSSCVRGERDRGTRCPFLIGTASNIIVS